MKNIIVAFLILLFPSTFIGQKVYRYVNATGTLFLEIDSNNNNYSLSSIWNAQKATYSPFDSRIYTQSTDSKEKLADGNLINWANGKLYPKKDTIICIDSKTRKKIGLLKNKQNDILKVIDWKEYKNKMDKSSGHIGWNDNPNEKVYLNDLLKESSIFYIRLEMDKNSVTGKAKNLKLYKWKSNIKSIEYEAK